LFWGVVLLEGRVVGVVSPTFKQDHHISVIGYGIHGGLRGRGISAEASIAVLKNAFDAIRSCRRFGLTLTLKIPLRDEWLNLSHDNNS